MNAHRFQVFFAAAQIFQRAIFILKGECYMSGDICFMAFVLD